MKRWLLLWIFFLTACGIQPLPQTNLTVPELNPTKIQSTDTKTSTPPTTVFAIVDGKTGYLVGGSQNGVWLNADMTAPHLIGREEYRSFNKNNLGEVQLLIGSKAHTIEEGPCTQNYTVLLTPSPAFIPGLKVGGKWEVMPRNISSIAPSEQFKNAIESLLIAQGLDDPQTQITHIYQVDLDGDQIDEYLITAIRMTSGGIFPNVSDGDYSIIVLQTMVNNSITTIPLVMDIYFDTEDLAYPTVYTVEGVYDLNGDGRLEVSLEGNRWEGNSILIFDIDGQTISEVMQVSCNE